jgi:hypothetical protein
MMACQRAAKTVVMSVAERVDQMVDK